MLNQELLLEMQRYVERHLEIFVSSNEIYEFKTLESIELEEFLNNNRKPTFRELLFRLIDKKNINDPVIYKKAGIDRKHFSKIRSNPNYLPKKNTIIALALALELEQVEVEELLCSAGYTLSFSETSDLVIQFCLERNIYDIDFVNEALHQFHLKPLI
ncbi:hypothetical protein [Gottfriedia luciferensis]|uniref:hypothetical protein n=1 Tax=Gottfriedia luciferensis TaxID=178774 RepID=UPI000B4452BE|nr:hypothetical protein [Gottfriedia luciferensis]